jgi:hypothetical protein
MKHWMLAALAALAPVGLAQKSLQSLTWGGYGVRIEGKSEGEQVARIISSGRTRLEVRDWRLEASLVEVTGKAPKELLLTDYSGGAHCCFTHYLFTQEGGLRNLMYEEWGDGGIQEVRDLDGDGRAELITVGVYSYFADLSFADSPGVTRVYAYDGIQLYDATRQFSARNLQQMQRYQSAFLEARRSGNVSGMKGSAMGYWVNALVIGRGAAAKGWLMQNAPLEVRKWLLDNEEAILNSTSAVRISYNRILPPPERR